MLAFTLSKSHRSKTISNTNNALRTRRGLRCISSTNGYHHLNGNDSRLYHYKRRTSPSQLHSSNADIASNIYPLDNIATSGTFSVLNSVPSMISGSDFEPSQTFEPQVNTPALVSFLIIAVVFSLLQFRINSVRNASIRREEALSLLRQLKSEQLNSSNNKGNGADDSRSNIIDSSSTSVNDQNEQNVNIMDQRVQDAIKAYELALKEELNLRTIIPGVRIVAPNDAARREEDIAAAKQFLDWDILADERQQSYIDEKSNSNDKMDSDEVRNSLLMQSRRRFDGKEESNTSSSSNNEKSSMSNGAKAILLTVAVSQIALLILLSLDPMSANNIFTEVAGTPTENLPFSSWSN